MDTKKLRQKILDLAIRGKLVPQDPNDEPASVLLERIRAEKERLIAEGKIKRSKRSKTSSAESHYQKFTPPFEIPDSWEWVRLEEITSKIGSGSTPRGSNYSIDGIPFFRSQNIYNHGLVYDDIKYISNEIHKSMSGTIVHPKDLLLNITGGSIGRCAIVPSDFNEGNVSQHVCIIRPILVKSEYLHCYIISDLFWTSMRLTGSGREGLPKYNLEQMLLPLPPLEEQKKIICSLKIYLDAISEIENSQDSLSNYISNAKSKILDLAMQGKLVPQDPTDEPAADILLRINPKAKIITDNQHYPQLPNNWAYVCLEDINDYRSKSITPANNPEKKFELYSVPTYPTGIPEVLKGKEIGSSKQLVMIGDVLVCKINPHLNRVWLITNQSDLNQIASSEWITVRNSGINSTFLKYYFKSPEFRKLLCSQVSGVGGSLTRAQPAIVKKYLIPIPPLKEQYRIAEFINNAMDRLKDVEASI